MKFLAVNKLLEGARRLGGARDVFASIERGVMVDDPYPHLVVENALPRDLADTLLTEMPPAEVFTRGSDPGSNVRYALPSPDALDDSRVSETWKAALCECNANMASLLAHFLHRFRNHLPRAYPNFASQLAPPDQLRAVPRYKPDRLRHEIGIDCQMVINTPALTAGTSVRGPHLDQPDKLISALLYLRAPDDDSTGGELQLYTPRSAGLNFDAANQTPFESVRLVHTYPYRHNLLILPLGVPDALHGVSPRGATPKPRYHLHIVGETAAKLFEIPR